MSRADSLAGLTEAIAGHTAEFYDWWDECDSDYYTCLCGEVRWHVNTSADYHRAHAAHVAAVALAWLEGHGWGPRGSQANRALLDESWAPVETGEDA